MRITTLLTATLAVSLASAAQSDEAWITNIGGVFYAEDEADAAVLQLRSENQLFRIYLPGAAGGLHDRLTHRGYWVSDSEGECAVSLGTRDGVDHRRWGEITLIFDDFTFPSGWTAHLTECFGDPVFGIRAEPDLGPTRP